MAFGDILIEEFYDYGRALQQGLMDPNHKNTRKLPFDFFINPHPILGGSGRYDTFYKFAEQRNLTDAETEEVDKWLAGDKLYQARMNRVNKLALQDPSQVETFKERERIRALSQYLDSVGKAIAIDNRKYHRDRAARTHTIYTDPNADIDSMRLLEGRPQAKDNMYSYMAGGPMKEKDFDAIYPRPLRNTTGSSPLVHRTFLNKTETAIKERIEEPRQQLVETLKQPSLWERIKDKVQSLLPKRRT